MSQQLGTRLIEAFLKNSSASTLSLAHTVRVWKSPQRSDVSMFMFHDGKRRGVTVDGSRFYLRTSTEYSNPQLNLEDLQGILASRLLEVTATRLAEVNRDTWTSEDIAVMARRLTEPPSGPIQPFLLNTDDVEADRYSINPLRASILQSGQSAYPAANVSVDGLSVDARFVEKYEGSLVCSKDIETIQYFLNSSASRRYIDFADAVKYHQLEALSKEWNINLTIPSLRMPLTPLKAEGRGGPLHCLIAANHASYEAVRTLYELMGRNITKHKSLLPTVPHSPRGFGSKRAAQGLLVFENDALTEVRVKYRPTKLYRNEVDHEDLSLADAHDDVTVPAELLRNYDYRKVPSSPQFALYSTLSPEDAAIWHGVGKYAGTAIAQSYTSIHYAHSHGEILKDVPKPHPGVPLQFDLVADKMMKHPAHGNIDASVNCVPDIAQILPSGTHMRILSPQRRGATGETAS
ncbi:MAG: hypothetical protein ACE5PO_06565 [Candidatus Bathyarchaeia archaeon]